MLVFCLSLCTFAFFGINQCLAGYYFVIAPNVIRYEHDETVSVNVFGLNNVVVKVWLEYDGKRFSEKNVLVQDEAHPAETTVRVTEADIFAAVVENKPRTIKICSEYAGSQQSREVVLSYHSGYLIVQTDKPIYTPEQKVQIRALALEESLKPSKDREVSLEITSPANVTMARKTLPGSDSGFYKNEFTLPPYPDFGVWTARAFYRGQFETTARVNFQVEEYVLPTYGVTIDVNVPYIMRTTPKVVVTVRAKYVYGKPVDGTARLTLNLKQKDGTTEYILDMNPASLQYDGGTEGSAKEFNIDTKSILESPLLKDRAFPDGSRLEIVARVYESATGKEEARSNDNTMFALKPFQFTFTRSKNNFRPGWEYYLKMDMTYANGQPAANQDVKIQMFRDGRFASAEFGKTDSNGQFLAIFITGGEANKLTFKASTADEQHESDDFKVTAYEGKNQILVETVSLEPNKLTMRAFTNIQGNEYTGMLFMVITRGKVVYTFYSEPANLKSEDLSEELQQYLSPTARLLVFYVDKSTNEMVADSIRFYVEETCRSQGLHMETMRSEILPGKKDQLTVTGSPHMWVGLNVMDKALLLLNDKNVLRKSKMFEALKSHDLGCGEGSGKSSGDVFKKSGLTVLTNAVVTDKDLERGSDSCDSQKRRKRSADNCYNLNPKCCSEGSDLAEDLMYTTEDLTKIDPYSLCYSGARQLALKKKLPTACIMAYFYSCKEDLEFYISDITNIVSKSLDDSEDYASDLAKLAEEGVQPVTRSDFRESWLFEVQQLSGQGEYKNFIEYPDSITEWMFQAIGISEENGMCIADPLEVKAYRDFFVQLDLPYKAVRLEYIDIKATVFNYGLPTDDDKTASVYIEAVDHLCFSGEPNKPSPKIQLDLPPNSANTVTIPMVPVKAGQFPIKVTAIVTDFGIPMVDVIEKRLLVVNEGIEEQITIQMCLDPNEDQKDCVNDVRVVSDTFSKAAQRERIMEVDLTLPKNSIAGTGGATGYILSNSFDNIVQTLLDGVETLFRLPDGCGEQTMIRLAPTVYAMGYLKQTKQITNEIEVKGNQWVRDGVNREVSQYRHADGAYAAWRSRPASTWLTAFVAKVFCQAKKVVDDAVDEAKDLALTINWLVQHAEPDGSFVDNQPVIHREMIGLIKERDPSLTSFVLISLMECPIRNPDVDNTKHQARLYIERLDDNILRNNPYLLALSTYALALAESPRKWHFKTLLESLAKEDALGMRWGSGGNAQSIETTGYALLAMLEFNDLSTSAKIVKWLTSQRDAKGVFRTTQDTVVGLQALSTYSIRTYSPDVNLDVTLLADNWNKQEQFTITKENAIVQHVVTNLPVERGNNKLTVRVKGTGSARMLIDLRYNRPAKSDEVCPFKVSDVEVDEIQDMPNDVNIAALRNCDVCGKCDDPVVPVYDEQAFGDPVEAIPKIESNFGRKKRAAGRQARATKLKKCIRFSVRSKKDKFHGMSIVNFGLETDIEVVKEDLDKLMNDTPNIARYEMPSQGSGFIVFYLDNITKEETQFVFRLKDNFGGNPNTRQPSYLKVYDYYQPDLQCTHIYGTGPNRGGAVSYRCDENNEQCKCVQSVCAQSVVQEILNMIRSGDRPAIKLLRYTCNPEKANYAVRVQIEEVDYDPEKEEKTARGIVLEHIHKGKEDLRPGDEMTFFWKLRCQQVEMERGKSYYVIGKDGNKFEDEDGLRYPVMTTTLVVEDSEENKVLKKVMTVYAQLMQLRGCQS